MRHSFFRAAAALAMLSFGLCAGTAPDPNRGLYAIWTKPEISDHLPWIKGGQVFLQWRNVEPAPGRYDFTELRQQLERLRELGRATTVQLNANVHPGFLFDRVPHVPDKLAPEQVGDRQGTIQYWHPEYIKAYTDLIAAYAREVKASPDVRRVTGIRLNYNAIGTEFTAVPPQFRDPAAWITPPGAQPGPPWTEETGARYRRTVLDAFIRAFAPEVRVFLRAGGPGYPDADPEVLRLADTGTVGLFTTGSEIEPSGPPLERRHRLFLQYCRSGKTVCYAESKADALGRHAGLVDKRWCGPQQYNYWRLLSDLNMGFSMIAVYGADLAHAAEPEYKDAFEFAARYAGYHASPKEARGAWVALREGKYLKGDYSFLMRRLPGPEMPPVQEAGPDDQRFGAWARTLPEGERVQFALDAAFARSMAGRKAVVRVVFLGRGEGAFTIRAGDVTRQQRLTGTGRWQTAELPVARCTFTGGDTPDISVEAGAAVTLHMIEVAR